ncbi:nicotinate phosphoribosyltransferase [Propionimicrobium sp. PCR01-08-3]|uniref:nicotinate phosphoribosyltransferase n=1 Tax=Propionimicrobium sp. PCR01-08-3 TaxID=3052086 RepID=UPI00255C3289|nr:nicotinate phosphoribosyltransferase [Propionimicrobium sp. PCR01-08-3]WIY83339.1 nicotinate phosphoribosyltransferase [Propionimicrobium sp. PCR01-08-3]
MTSTALLTDMYELTMIKAAMHAGVAFRRCTFDLFPRRLPTGRSYGVVAGTGRALEGLKDFRFGPDEIAFLTERGVADDMLAEWLADYRFSGTIRGYREGELFFSGSPVMVVEGSFAEVVVLETLLLSIFNHDSAVASAASRMTLAAEGRPIIEMGGRRTHEWAAVASARAAWIAGFGPSSDLEAGRSWGIPVSGTAAHAFTMLFDSEEEAFEAQLETMGEDTTLLVDTYDVDEAIRKAVELTDGRIGAIRIDSGDLTVEVRRVRKLLDSLGATKTRIIVTNDLDEYQIAALRGAPVDGFGVGTSVVTGSGHPTCGMVYKMVSRANSDDPDAEQHPVAKKSQNKGTIGGRKTVMRQIDEHGVAVAEVIGVDVAPRADSNDRMVMDDLVRDGEIVGTEPLSAARDRHAKSRAELPLSGQKISRAEQAIPTVYVSQRGESQENIYLIGEAPANL